MNSESKSSSAAGKGRKLAVQLVVGMLAGVGGMASMLFLLERQGALAEEPSRLFALTTAMVFFLMGLFGGLGALAPRLGEKTLNVEDADEIEEQKTALLVGSATFLLVALLLGALGLARGPDGLGPLSPAVSAVLAGGAGLAVVLISIRFRSLGDEMTRLISKEVNGWAVFLNLAVFGNWAGLAHLGYAPMFGALTLVAGLFALYLLSLFIVIGRRGMLKPR